MNKREKVPFANVHEIDLYELLEEEQKKNERLTIRINNDTKEKLQIIAKNENRSMSNLVNAFIEQLVNQYFL